MGGALVSSLVDVLVPSVVDPFGTSDAGLGASDDCWPVGCESTESAPGDEGTPVVGGVDVDDEVVSGSDAPGVLAAAVSDGSVVAPLLDEVPLEQPSGRMRQGRNFENDRR